MDSEKADQNVLLGVTQQNQSESSIELCKANHLAPGLVMHLLNPSTWEAETVCEFKTSLVSLVSSRLARATQ